MYNANNTTATANTAAPTTARNPNRIHATFQNLGGSLKAGIGRMTGNPNTVMAGEEKKIAARAEVERANLHRSQVNGMAGAPTGTGYTGTTTTGMGHHHGHTTHGHAHGHGSRW
ncbi:hypothetical protein HK104_008226 [Borealophlyctis nickersoniae]|nr:hypothetical protein HK104_008226 [Borealophlyctis nickersoniae]